jgi:hypothetical protein
MQMSAGPASCHRDEERIQPKELILLMGSMTFKLVVLDILLAIVYGIVHPGASMLDSKDATPCW